jgi:hypothetical protein
MTRSSLPALLQLRGLIEHQDRVRIGQVREDGPLQPLQHRLPVPGVLGQQRLHPPRRGVPGLLAQLPARLAVTGCRQQRPMYATATTPDLACANAGQISPDSSPSSFRSQVRSPTMAPAATSYGSCFVTNPRS